MGRCPKISKKDLKRCYPDRSFDSDFLPTHRARVYSIDSRRRRLRTDFVRLDPPRNSGVQYAYVPFSEDPFYGVRPDGTWQCLVVNGQVETQEIEYVPDYVKPLDREGYVYFVQAGEDGPIKIGWSQDVTRRVAELQTANARRLRLLGVVPGTLRTELDFHKRFAELRMEAEWFKNHESLVSFIEKAVGSWKGSHG